MCLNHPGKVIAMTGADRAIAERLHEIATVTVLADDTGSPSSALAETTSGVEAASPNP